MTIDRDLQTDALVIPTAKGNFPLQIVRWSGQREAKTLSASSQRIALVAGSEIIEISSTQNCFINFGDGTEVASSTIANNASRFFLAGVQIVPVPLDPATGNPYVSVAVIQQSIAGTFQIETGEIKPIPTPITGDPDFASVVLLLDFAGADGATDITDLSNSGHVDSFFGQAQVDTAVQFLGVNTLLCDGVGDFVTFPDSPDWDFGTSDFTIELGVRLAETDKTYGFISTYDPPNGWLIQRTNTGLLRFGVGDTSLYSEAWAATIDTFFHIAVSRSGTDLRVFVDGVQLGATVTDSTNFVGSTADAFLGSLSAALQPLDGFVGAVRVTKGVARYTANFTPLTEFYPTS